MKSGVLIENLAPAAKRFGRGHVLP
jgi:hypothetical protein